MKISSRSRQVTVQSVRKASWDEGRLRDQRVPYQEHSPREEGIKRMKTTVHKQKCTYMPADTEEKTQANQRNKESTWKKKFLPIPLMRNLCLYKPVPSLDYKTLCLCV